MTQLSLSPEFRKTIVDLHGETGAQWLQNLPDLVEKYAQTWDLQIESPIADLSYNFVVRTKNHNGDSSVLKAGLPHAELTGEIAALRTYQGKGCVTLLQADAEAGIFLIEAAVPGTPLKEWTLEGPNPKKDEEATEIAAHVISNLQSQSFSNTILSSFPSVADWAPGFKRLRNHFGGSTGPFDKDIVDRAEKLYQELIESTDRSTLLHGDLHHSNILQSSRQPWLAIDPKGVVGDPAYEVGAFIRNPVSDFHKLPDLKKALRRRIDQFSEILNFDRKRILAWSFSQAVLASWWKYEDLGRDWEAFFGVAKILLEIEKKK